MAVSLKGLTILVSKFHSFCPSSLSCRWLHCCYHHDQSISTTDGVTCLKWHKQAFLFLPKRLRNLHISLQKFKYLLFDFIFKGDFSEISVLDLQISHILTFILYELSYFMPAELGEKKKVNGKRLRMVLMFSCRDALLAQTFQIIIKN